MITSVLGLIIGLGAILLGNALEGGHIEALIQPTAALIVFGGTLGATMLSSSVEAFSGSIRGILKSMLAKEPKFPDVVNQLVELATLARKEGVLALEGEIPKIENAFMAANLRRIVDGFDPSVLTHMMEDAVSREETNQTAIAKVYDTAGGFAPTVGIIGAVLGLIHVMSNLSDSSKLGAGIAVAFVATVYGVGLANLIILPMGNRLKDLAKKEVLEMEVIVVGLQGIQSGLNPRVIEAKLGSLLGIEIASADGEGERKAA